MTSQIDWQREIDLAVADAIAGQPQIGPDRYLAAGRRAVRRRRTTTVGAAAALAIVAGLGWASVHGSSNVVRRGTIDRSAASDATPRVPASTAHDTEILVPEGFEADIPWATLIGNDLQLEPDVQLLERIVDPLDSVALHTSIAVVLRKGTEEKWFIYEDYPGDSSSTASTEPLPGVTFEEWVDSQAAFDRWCAANMPILSIDPYLEPKLGVLSNVTVLERRFDPPEAAGYKPAFDSAAAKLRIPGGRELFVLAVELEPNHSPELVLVEPDDLDVPSMEGFLAYIEAEKPAFHKPPKWELFPKIAAAERRLFAQLKQDGKQNGAHSDVVEGGPRQGASGDDR